jgi:hypothetical protein
MTIWDCVPPWTAYIQKLNLKLVLAGIEPARAYQGFLDDLAKRGCAALAYRVRVNALSQLLITTRNHFAPPSFDSKSCVGPEAVTRRA